MAGHEGQPGGYIQKKGGDDVAVAPCKGWTDACEFCDKRFCQWEPADDEILERIPSKPGAFMFALKNKNITEVVNITVSPSNIQNLVFNESDILRTKVADKKSKATKSTILIRWMVFKKAQDKDMCTLYAHWYNYGVLPKYLLEWPGESFLKEVQHFVYCTKTQKWCYPKKDPVWRKQKTAPTVTAEFVEKCNWFEPCSYCDAYFTSWKPVNVTVDEDLAPEELGICMFSVKYKKKREVILISSEPEGVDTYIKSTIKRSQFLVENTARNDKFLNQVNSYYGTAEVRWLVLKHPNTENACFLYAHWLNTDTHPMLNFKMPGEKILEKNKQFVLRLRDKKWCYEITTEKPHKFSKCKNKREILDEIEDEFSTTT